MKLPNELLLTYQAEYEQNQDMTIQDLCDKYSVTTKQLKGYTKWKKPIASTEVLEPIATAEVIEPVAPIEITDDIESFKKLAISHALKFMRDDVEFAEVKEFKDMVSIVGTIEASYKDTKPENTINIAIQNIVKGFQDDC